MYCSKKKNLKNLLKFTNREMASEFISPLEMRINAVFDNRLIDDFIHGELVPLSHLTENNSKWILQIDLPGVKKKNIIVTVTCNHIVVQAKLEEAYHVSRHGDITEFEYLKKTIALPSYVNTKKISARLKNGILTIVIPKITAGKKVPIT